jgi:hypothetical protein
MSQQPDWELLENLGDASPVDYGGYFVYADRTGVYTEEAELLEAPDDDDAPEGWTVYRVTLDRCKLHNGHLIPYAYDASWPHPVSAYVEWFDTNLDDVAASMDYHPVEKLRADLCAANPVRRAHAYRALGDYHGWENFDSDPLTFHDRAEVEARYQEELTQ